MQGHCGGAVPVRARACGLDPPQEDASTNTQHCRAREGGTEFWKEGEGGKERGRGRGREGGRENDRQGGREREIDREREREEGERERGLGIGPQKDAHT